MKVMFILSLNDCDLVQYLGYINGHRLAAPSDKGRILVDTVLSSK
jgi:hypothetical protein